MKKTRSLWTGSFIPAGGGGGTRTPGLYSAIVALSQLSYAPQLQEQVEYTGAMINGSNFAPRVDSSFSHIVDFESLPIGVSSVHRLMRSSSTLGCDSDFGRPSQRYSQVESYPHNHPVPRQTSTRFRTLRRMISILGGAPDNYPEGNRTIE